MSKDDYKRNNIGVSFRRCGHFGPLDFINIKGVDIPICRECVIMLMKMYGNIKKEPIQYITPRPTLPNK